MHYCFIHWFIIIYHPYPHSSYNLVWRYFPRIVVLRLRDFQIDLLVFLIRPTSQICYLDHLSVLFLFFILSFVRTILDCDVCLSMSLHLVRYLHLFFCPPPVISSILKILNDKFLSRISILLLGLGLCKVFQVEGCSQ